MAHLKRNHPLPLYVQLLETLRADIMSRKLLPHQQLPSERELGDRFRVSRMTVRQALADLSRDGFIYTRVGKGTFVSEPKINQQLKTLTGFSQDMESRGNKPSSRVLEAKLERSSDAMAGALHIASGTEVAFLSRVRLSDGTPLAIETVHIPHSLCPNLLQHDFATESLYNVLERDYGFRLTHAEQTIEAALCSAHEATLLQLNPPAPVLVMERLTFTDQDIPIEHVHSVYRGDRYKFHSTLAPRSESRVS